MTENHVRYYTTGVAILPVHFPEDRTVCQWCPFVRCDESLKRCRCLLTLEYLPYPFTSRGDQCPVTFSDKEEST